MSLKFIKKNPPLDTWFWQKGNRSKTRNNSIGQMNDIKNHQKNINHKIHGLDKKKMRTKQEIS
jgi:hypothetical protein